MADNDVRMRSTTGLLTLSTFHTVFVSSELGKRKPAPEAFYVVAEAVGAKLPWIVCFDDPLENIEEARVIGLRAIHMKQAQRCRPVAMKRRWSSCALSLCRGRTSSSSARRQPTG